MNYRFDSFKNNTYVRSMTKIPSTALVKVSLNTAVATGGIVNFRGCTVNS